MDVNGSWELQVPRSEGDLEDLWAQCRRHGIEPGGLVRVVAVVGQAPEPGQ